MKDINYAFMLIKANKLDGAKDLLEELLKSDPQDKDILFCMTDFINNGFRAAAIGAEINLSRSVVEGDFCGMGNLR